MVDNIKMDLGEVGWSGMDWIGLAEDRDQWMALVNSAMKVLEWLYSGGISKSVVSLLVTGNEAGAIIRFVT
jgi:hypothetical protein